MKKEIENKEDKKKASKERLTYTSLTGLSIVKKANKKPDLKLIKPKK